MPCYFTRGLLTHRAVNPLCIDERPTSTSTRDTDAKAVVIMQRLTHHVSVISMTNRMRTIAEYTKMLLKPVLELLGLYNVSD